VFYNSYLPAIATDDQQDRVSARGFSYGYLGSTLLLMVSLALILGKDALGVTDGGLMPRIVFLLTGLWWVGFAQIPFARLPDNLYATRPPRPGSYLFNGYRELLKVWRRLKKERLLRTFLFSFFFYIMGLQTVMFMAASFGEKEVGLTQVQLIVTIILLQFEGILGAYVFAWLSRRIGNFNGLIVAAVVWIGICTGSYFIRTPSHFYVAAGFIGAVMGGMQALSRSTYSKLIPLTKNNAGYFSFYDVCEKTAMMSGLVLWGVLDNLTGSMRMSITTLVVWFTVSLAGLLWAKRLEAKG
jgi:UMF1 family MFS transporter